MAKVYNFHRRDRNRFRKVYRYIRKKPHFEFCSDGNFNMIAGFVDFSKSAGPVTYTFPATANFSNVPVITVTAVDHLSTGGADVNAFVTSITTTSAQISVSDIFTGRVHFVIVSQD
jgi:hypothetical protein